VKAPMSLVGGPQACTPGRSGATGSEGAAGTVETEQRRSGTRKKKEKKEMVTDRWGRAEGMTEKEEATEMTKKEGNDCEKKK
jgi:hypothetical protein